MAAINGIWLAHNAGASNILLQTDCMAVIQTLSGTISNERLRRIWQEARQRYQFGAIATRHVKGHTQVADKRSWVNRWCDREAGKHMRAQRKGK